MNSLEIGKEVFKKKSKLCSNSPGVYQVFDEKNKIIYVGKAKNLPNRLINYASTSSQPIRTERMIASTCRIDTISTLNESEALLLEANLIKKNKPILFSLGRLDYNKNNIIVAYEPIWSIGTGKIPTAHELKKTTIHIKKVLKGIFKKNSPAVLYGGSVDGSNVEMFKEIKEIDGFLVGGASKTSKKFIDIIKNYYR
mgnify:CR=1 FL=1